MSYRKTEVCVVSCMTFMATAAAYVLRDSFTRVEHQLFAGVASSAVSIALLLYHRVVVLRDKNWFGVDTAFIIPFWVVHFYVAVRWLCGDLNTANFGTMYNFADIDRLPQAVLLSALGLIAFICAYLLESYGIPIVLRTRKPHARDMAFGTLKKMAYCSLALSGIATVVYVAKYAAEGHFASSYTGGSDNYIVGVAAIMLDVSFRLGIVLWFIHACRSRWTYADYASVVYAASVIMLFVVLGDRTLLFAASISVIALYAILKRRIPVYGLVALIALGFVCSAFIQIARTSDRRTLGSFVHNGLERSEHIDFLSGVDGFAGSTLPALTQSFAIVPEMHPHLDGLLLAQGIASTIPFYARLFPWLPAANEYKYRNSPSFITYHVLGGPGLGLGTTTIADLYIDLGPVGVVVGMALLGCFCGAVIKRVRAANRSMYDLVLYALLVGVMASISRYSIVSLFMRHILWPLCLMYLLLLAFKCDLPYKWWARGELAARAIRRKQIGVAQRSQSTRAFPSSQKRPAGVFHARGRDL